MNPDVLVIGAGPTGLAAAAILSKLGRSVRIIDRNSARSDKTKAIGVQAGTLECLDAVFGKELSRTMIEAGRLAREAWFDPKGGRATRVDLSVIPSRYNSILILAQSETERIFEERLQRSGVRVERGTELLDITQPKDWEVPDATVAAKLKNAQGETEEVRARFLIGCDGAHSATRKLVDIPFQGSSYMGDFTLGDVRLSWPWPYGSIRALITERGIIAAFPLKDRPEQDSAEGRHRYRLIVVSRKSDSKPGSEATAEIGMDEFRSLIETISPGQITLHESIWLTRFRLHHRLAREFQRGRIFLAGDAAHIHSPAGGQGMNTGIQDALNLGFKLNRVLLGKTQLVSLRQYEAERMRVARAVVRSTDLAFRLGMMPENPFTSIVRRKLLPLILSSRMLQKWLLTAVSEVNVARQEIARYDGATV